jgi:hypothetical protein
MFTSSGSLVPKSLSLASISRGLCTTISERKRGKERKKERDIRTGQAGFLRIASHFSSEYELARGVVARPLLEALHAAEKERRKEGKKKKRGEKKKEIRKEIRKEKGNEKRKRKKQGKF